MNNIPPTMHECARPGCETVVPLGFVCCRPCYLSIPKDARAVLADCFQKREQEPAMYAAAVAMTVELVG